MTLMFDSPEITFSRSQCCVYVRACQVISLQLLQTTSSGTIYVTMIPTREHMKPFIYFWVSLSTWLLQDPKLKAPNFHNHKCTTRLTAILCKCSLNFIFMLHPPRILISLIICDWVRKLTIILWFTVIYSEFGISSCFMLMDTE